MRFNPSGDRFSLKTELKEAENLASLVYEGVSLRRDGASQRTVSEFLKSKVTDKKWGEMPDEIRSREGEMRIKEILDLIEGALLLHKKKKDVSLKGPVLCPKKSVSYVTPKRIANYRAELCVGRTADLGCGVGFQLAALLEKDNFSVGVERDKTLVKYARFNLYVNGYPPEAVIEGNCLEYAVSKKIGEVKTILSETSRVPSSTRRRFSEISPDPRRSLEIYSCAKKAVFDLPPRFPLEDIFGFICEFNESGEKKGSMIPVFFSTAEFSETKGRLERLTWIVERDGNKGHVKHGHRLCVRSLFPSASLCVPWDRVSKGKKAETSVKRKVGKSGRIEVGMTVGLISEAVLLAGLEKRLAETYGENEDSILNMGGHAALVLPSSSTFDSPPFFENVFTVEALLPRTWAALWDYFKHHSYSGAIFRFKADRDIGVDRYSRAIFPLLRGGSGGKKERKAHVFEHDSGYVIMTPL